MGSPGNRSRDAAGPAQVVQMIALCRAARSVLELRNLTCNKHVARRQREQSPPSYDGNLSEQT